MNKKEIYDKKIEIIKQFLSSDGNIDVLIKVQNEENSYLNGKDEKISNDEHTD